MVPRVVFFCPFNNKEVHMTANKRYEINNNNTEEDDELLIDEEELLANGLSIREPQERRELAPRFEYTPALVDRLLAEAGYEPNDMPKGLRRAALDVALAWKKGLGNDGDIAQATGRTPHDVRKAARALAIAGNPNPHQGGER
jgi:hypothetical protein